MGAGRMGRGMLAWDASWAWSLLGARLLWNPTPAKSMSNSQVCRRSSLPLPGRTTQTPKSAADIHSAHHLKWPCASTRCGIAHRACPCQEQQAVPLKARDVEHVFGVISFCDLDPCAIPVIASSGSMKSDLRSGFRACIVATHPPTMHQALSPTTSTSNQTPISHDVA